MRKILMAATAIAGVAGAMVGTANAQMPNQPIVSDSFGQNGVGGDFPAPGTVVVRLRARVDVEFGYGTDSGSVGKSGKTNAQGTGQAGNGYKNQGQFMGSAVRIYPGADGVAANGLKYGGAIELRVSGGGGTGLGIGQGSGTNTPYVRRSFLYFSGGWGKVIIGQNDGGLGQLINVGALEAFDWTGGLNGSTQFLNGGVQPSWSFWENGGAYVNNKMVYLTPKYMGFDAGISYEPNQTTNDNGTNANQASSTSNTLASGAGNIPARRNTFEVAGRYTGSFSGVGVNVQAGYVGAGTIANSTNFNGNSATYQGLSIWDAGLNVTYAGFTVGGHATGGVVGTNYAPIRNGQTNNQTYLIGANYQKANWIFGGHYLNELSAGTYNPAYPERQLHEIGGAFGGAIDWMPGTTAYVSAVYIQRHQAGVDLLNGGLGQYNNGVVGRYLMVGNVFKW